MDITKEYLYQKYIIENLTIIEVARDCNVSKSLIKGRLRRFGIRKGSLKLGTQVYDNRDWLYDQYIRQKKGYTVIAKEQNVSYTTILTRVLYWGWELRGHDSIDKGAPRRGSKHTFDSLDKIRKSRLKKRVITYCKQCNEELELVKSSFKKSNHNFCNQKCFKSYLKENRVLTINITDSAAYKEWRLKVYKRDGYRCKMPDCLSQSRSIAAHHIYPKKKYPVLQFEITNGITLCKSCHEKTYGKEELFIDMLVRVVQTMNGK